MGASRFLANWAVHASLRLIFIPFQDEYCFENDGILTREYAMLRLFAEAGHELHTVVNKPRTALDAKSIVKNPSMFPAGSIEAEILSKLDAAEAIDPKRLFSIKQLTAKRGWWVDAYLDVLDRFPADLNGYLVYTNTPFAWKLVRALKERGAMVAFDSMDNMMTYPHFWESEKVAAKEGYGELLALADYACANSQRTVDFFESEFGRSVELVKNGVFQPKRIDATGLEQAERIRSAKARYARCAGFVGKFGLRIDHEFIDDLAKANGNCLFVFVGLELSGQCGAFNEVVAAYENVLKLPALPSAYLYEVLDLFDILMIPYAVGKNENSGDPLKLYQYFMTGKPIACTPIREVDEYANLILVSHDVKEWSALLREGVAEAQDYTPVLSSVLWQERARNLLRFFSET